MQKINNVVFHVLFMEINPDIIETVVGAFSAFVAGGGLSFIFWKKKAAQAVSNLTPAEVVNIAIQFTAAIDKASQAGEEISPQEAEDLGRAIWTAVKT